MARELIALALAAGCAGRAHPAQSRAAAPAAATRSPLAQSEVARVELEPPVACARESSCEARLVVHALGEFRVNADYPTKFVAAADSATIDGTGDFVPAETTGVLTLRFRASGAGPTRINGVFKFSVCTEEVCKIEEPAIAFAVPKA